MLELIPDGQNHLKKKLKKLLLRYIESVKIQMSGEKILNFLVNDILDYAQINAGKFRKYFLKFNIKDCVDEIILILKFKA